jgi:hypothetical protein
MTNTLKIDFNLLKRIIAKSLFNGKENDNI